MKYKVYKTTGFKKSLRKILRRGKDIDKLEAVVQMLSNDTPLPQKYRDHALTGNFVGFRDCHIENDWVLIYKIQNDILILTLADTGTHSDLGL
jgi:mRNA interferase YafQ